MHRGLVLTAFRIVFSLDAVIPFWGNLSADGRDFFFYSYLTRHYLLSGKLGDNLTSTGELSTQNNDSWLGRALGQRKVAA